MSLDVSKLPRVSIAHLPTPLEFAPRLTQYLGGPQIWIKRDDCTGLAFGGNKARKLEFFLGDALEKGSDAILTMGPVQSNHVRMTAAAARKFGLECHAVLVGDSNAPRMGNFLLDQLLGLEYNLIPGSLDDLPPGLVEQEIENYMTRLAESGRKPYLVPPGGAGPLGELSYSLAAQEIEAQSRKLRINVDYIVVPVGSQGTLSGLILGKKLRGLNANLIGISVCVEGTAESAGLPSIEDMVKEAGKLLKAQVEVSGDDYELLFDYVGDGYGIPTDECISAIKLLAQKEGILVDPTYTGKSLAGLIDLARRGKFNKKDVVVYLHTGGGPGLFSNPAIFD